MINRRRGERILLDEQIQLSLVEPELDDKGPFPVDEMSYQFGRKYGVHLNLLTTGLRFTGPAALEVGQEISFLLPDQPETFKGTVSWKKKVSETNAMFGVKIDIFLNRRRNDRRVPDETIEMSILEPEQSDHGSCIVDEISFGLSRRHGVHLSPLVIGLRFKGKVDLKQGQSIRFKLSNQDEEIKGVVVWRETTEDALPLYGVKAIYLDEDISR